MKNSRSGNLLLLLVSCVAGLFLCEVSLRIFYPKYRHLAKAPFRQDAIRIWTRMENSRDWIGSPDTHLIHAFHHNNLSLRQHRNFDEADFAAAINVGIFGDSFVENILMDAPYSLTEPLDFLLNSGAKRFNVLNFGTHGYRPGQSFLHYENFCWVKNLDHVFFVYFINDLEDLWINDLFRIEAGELERNKVIRTTWLASLFNRLHLTYLLLESGVLSSPDIMNDTSLSQELMNRYRARLSVREKISKEDLKESKVIFSKLIRKWKHLVETNGGTFHFVTLPNRPVQPEIASILVEENLEVISLYDCFGDHDATHFQLHWQDSPYKYRNDSHWNEAGNRMASICLYRVLEEITGLPKLSEDELRKRLLLYYSTFDRWTPQKYKRRGGGGATPQTLVRIREKYQAFDESDFFERKIEHWLPEQSRLIIDSEFDVYLDERRLFYVKVDCEPANIRDAFFLHVVPTEKNDLYQDRVQYGFENLDFYAKDNSGRATVSKIGENSCGIKVNLPNYAIKSIRTGQYVPDKGVLWEGEFHQ